MRVYENPIGYHLFAYVAAIACLAAVVDGAIQQVQMLFLGGQVIAGNSVLKAALVVAVCAGCIVHPRIDFIRIPVWTWIIAITFLIFEIGYLDFARGMSLYNILLSYYDSYLLLLMGPVLLVFRGAIADKSLSRYVTWIFLICAAIGIAQYITNQPLLRTESTDGSFTVESWEFIGQVRAFSLFGSALEFGIFCALNGALGIALAKTRRLWGGFLWLISAVACFATYTRLCYIMFACACLSSLIFTFGKKPTRGRWYPAGYFILGMITLLAGLSSLATGTGSNLEDTGSLFMRINQWSFYYNLLNNSTLIEKLFGLGIVQNPKILPLFPMIIDNSPLALILHIGFVGFLMFSVLIWKMWLYLRREAVVFQQPFAIAAASLWSTVACVGIFNIVFSVFGAVFAVAVLCQATKYTSPSPTYAIQSTEA